MSNFGLVSHFDARKNYDGSWTTIPRFEPTREDLYMAFMCGGLREDFDGDMRPDGTITYIHDYATWMEAWLKNNNKTASLDKIYNYLNEIGIY